MGTKLELHEETLRGAVPRSTVTYFLTAAGACNTLFRNVRYHRYNPSPGNTELARNIAEVLIAMTHLAQYIGVDRVNGEIEKVLGPLKNGGDK